MIKQSRGFTLIEIIVALAIFGMLSIGAYTVLDAGVRSQQQTEFRLDELSKLQRTIQSIEKDLQMLSLRIVRDELGDKIPLLRGQSDPSGQASFIEFTRANWRNPAHLPRSNLQHVIYNFTQGELTRQHNLFLDQAANSPKVTRNLLQDMHSMSIGFLDKNNQWQTSWGIFGGQSSEVPLPKAIKISMEIDTFGLIERIILVDLVANTKQAVKQ
ncbi:MAG: type II secretion system protein GspJ [Gammaproteobacteria bacterium]|nr:MAG: type II secretion system protein GspJ [Gammaproteobacteria bacterium]